MSARPTRPLLRYLGGKWRLAPWIIEHLPPHRVYVEPFGGAANVLLRKPRAQTEVYNDLDDDVVNLFRVLRDPAQACALQALLRLTPYARSEWAAAYEPAPDPVEKARRLIVRSYMGFGSCASRADRNTGFRSGDRGPHRPASSEWAAFPDALSAIIERLADVTIECRPAAEVIAARDGTDAVFYVDPPYVHSTRSPKRTRTAPSNGYAHELTDADHVALLDQLLTVAGGVVLSGYDCSIYDRALRGWHRVARATLADGARPRIEVLWINPVAREALNAAGRQRDLLTNAVREVADV